MSLDSMLVQIARAVIPDGEETQSIVASLKAMGERLDQSLGKDVKKKDVFGSFTRGTMLSRAADERSDVDMMIVFNDNEYQPQTYLNRLKGFAEGRYPTSDVRQSRPSIVVQLNHISFDLVPAVDFFFDGRCVPKTTTEWQAADSGELDENLRKLECTCRGSPVTAIVLCKYWNVLNGRELDSFDIEKAVVGVAYWQNPELPGLFANAIAKVVENELNDTEARRQLRQRVLPKLRSLRNAIEERRTMEVLLGMVEQLPRPAGR